jgi:hypothetical protein
MAERKSASSKKEPSKAELQRRMEATRESISATVSEIKETVEDQYESVKQTVSGITEWREQFLKEPLVWSLGALAAGFALGYTLGYAHKNTKAARGKQSEIAAFADSVIDELSAVGNSMVMPALNSRVRQLFGFDVSEVLGEIESARKGARKGKPQRKRVAKKLPSAKGKAKKVRAAG